MHSLLETGRKSGLRQPGGVSCEEEAGFLVMRFRARYNLVLLCALASWMAACGRTREPVTPASGLRVVASIPPIADFARQVGGDRVQVETLVPAGASPHTYEPTPAQLRAVVLARVLVLNGVGLEFWADKVISSADNADLAIVTVSDGMKIIAGDADEPGGNPHTWLNPVNAMLQVEKIRDVFIQADPGGAGAYRANAEKYLEQLRVLDGEIRAEVAGFSSRQFIAFHSAWSYFAGEYGLEEAAVIERSPGRDASPSEIAEIIMKAREIKARAIFAEPQFSARAAETIADECEARVLFLNPLGIPPDYRYVDLMRYNMSQIAEALR